MPKQFSLAKISLVLEKNEKWPKEWYTRMPFSHESLQLFHSNNVFHFSKQQWKAAIQISSSKDIDTVHSDKGTREPIDFWSFLPTVHCFGHLEILKLKMSQIISSNLLKKAFTCSSWQHAFIFSTTWQWIWQMLNTVVKYPSFSQALINTRLR